MRDLAFFVSVYYENLLESHRRATICKFSCAESSDLKLRLFDVVFLLICLASVIHTSVVCFRKLGYINLAVEV